MGNREKGRKARLALEVDSELKTPRVHWGLGRPGTRRAQGRAGPRSACPLCTVAFPSGEGALWKHRGTPGENSAALWPELLGDHARQDAGQGPPSGVYMGPQGAPIRAAATPRPSPLLRLLPRSQDSGFGCDCQQWGAGGGVASLLDLCLQKAVRRD